MAIIRLVLVSLGSVRLRRPMIIPPNKVAAHLASPPRLIKAKFGGRCMICNLPIVAAEEIYWNPATKWTAHRSCVVPDATGNPAVAPTADPSPFDVIEHRTEQQTAELNDEIRTLEKELTADAEFGHLRPDIREGMRSQLVSLKRLRGDAGV